MLLAIVTVDVVERLHLDLPKLGRGLETATAHAGGAARFQALLHQPIVYYFSYLTGKPRNPVNALPVTSAGRFSPLCRYTDKTSVTASKISFAVPCILPSAQARNART
jgi:hypothetical protein